MKNGHISVLYEETLQALPLKQGQIFVDGTLGGGGHAEGILTRSHGKLIGIDKDDAAIARTKERLQSFGDRFLAVKSDFKQIKAVLEKLQVASIDGAILDLGVSSYQLDEIDRGFSYQREAKLDMRMDQTQSLSAMEVVNEYSIDQLREIIFRYGEEKFGAAIAKKIVAHRPIETTVQLAEVIKEAIPAAKRRTGGHPAKRTFQAIRIEVNKELSGLSDALDDFIDALAPGGRLAVISFHSLEDRIVKQAFQRNENPCICPPDFPQCVCGRRSKGRRVNRKPILPSEEEMNQNPRAKSAKLRIFEKTKDKR